jgi:hypothetical protein
MVRELGRENVSVANPGKLHVIAKSAGKDDRNDAYWLGWLLHHGQLPAAHIPEGVRRDLRIACRELRCAAQRRGEVLVRIKSHLAQAGKKHLVPKSWNRTRGGQAKLKEVAEGIEGERGRALKTLLGEVESLDGVVAGWRVRVEALSTQLPEVGALMKGLPGVGLIVASALAGELNEAGAYPNAKAYAQATGLPPDNRKTAGKVVSSRMSRAGSRLARWALTHAALACLRCKSGPGLRVRVWLLQMMRHKKKKMAIVAVARKLAEAAWRLLNLGVTFDLERAFPLNAEGEKTLAALRAEAKAKAKAAPPAKKAQARQTKTVGISNRSGETEAGHAAGQPAEG